MRQPREELWSGPPFKGGLRGLLWWLVAAALLAAPGPASAREAFDMIGRRIELPEDLQRVYVASPPETYLVYAIDAMLLVGLNVPVKEADRELLHPDFCARPVIGGYFGEGNTPNLEMLLKVRPQLVIGWTKNPAAEKFEAFLTGARIPVAYFSLEKLTDYPRAMRIMGGLLQRQERAGELAAYTERVLEEILAKVAAIPVEKRPRVYYAEGADGLSTDGDPSWHAELIGLAGGRNVHHCRIEGRYGMEKVSIEQVLLYRPEVILVQEQAFFDRVFSDPRWSTVPAVRNRRVYLIPKRPFNWFDRPPSFMRVLGLQWVAGKLHPELFDPDPLAQAQQFYRLFLDKSLSVDAMRSIMDGREL